MQIKQTRDLTSPYYQDGLAIRQAVFVDEQKVPAELEIDEFEDQALYFTGYLEQHPVTTLRVLTEGDFYHVQRVATMKAYRHQGLGLELMQAAETSAKENGRKGLILNAQVTAVPFYERLGYHATDKQHFLDAGILHQEMIKIL
ncbi:N-acetyltransferase [Latilactobacillus sakei]|nr:GNAT family N-acetyltransferase [Latilactobacillus sakei]AUX12380.1 N-acetyltransferase [Latilactobacillus sakei]